MKKSTKGALAAGAAAVLLLGGAGTLAFWSDTATIDGGTVDTGTLALSDAECDADWVYADGNANAGATVDLIVPGDTIAKVCTVEVTATGDNLRAKLETPSTIPITTSPDAPSLDATARANYAIEGQQIPDLITSANDGDTVTATLEVEFPFGDETTNGNDTQGILAELDELSITLTQVGTGA